MIKITFDGNEYFNFTSIIAEHNIDQNLAFKSINAQAIATEPFKDFITLLNSKNYVLARVLIKDKLFLEGFVNNENFGYSDTSNGTFISINISDRFIGVKESDLISTKPKGSLESYLSNVLNELNYNGTSFIDTYNKKIKSTKDFILIGEGVSNKNLKTFQKPDLVDYDGSKTIAEICSVANVILISNGYDTLSIEKANAYPNPIFNIIRSGSTNISHAEKVGKRSLGLTPSKIIILNPQDDKDSNSSVVAYNDNGLPHIQKINHISTKLTYSEISKHLDYNFAGIKARTNSFIYKCKNVIFDDNGEFFLPNRCINVLDEKYGIKEVMTLLQVSFSIDSSQGTEIAFNLTTKGAFDDNASIKQKRALMKK